MIFQADASLLQQSQSRRGSKQSIQSREKIDKYPTRFDFDHEKILEKQQQTTAQPKTSSSTEKDSSEIAGIKSSSFAKYDVGAATFLDVAVMRCLFISHWQEEGVYWSLHYMYNR